MPQLSVTAVRKAEWPMNRPTDQVIAERMLAAALHNYHKACTTPSGDHDFTTWDQMTEEQRAFYIEWAVPQAMQAIWRNSGKGR